MVVTVGAVDGDKKSSTRCEEIAEMVKSVACWRDFTLDGS
jgi:hypothetical protein